MISYTKLPCVICHKKSTPEGHDPCLGTLEGVMNACCGHGTSQIYIQYPPPRSVWLGGKAAILQFERLNVGPFLKKITNSVGDD